MITTTHQKLDCVTQDNSSRDLVPYANFFFFNLKLSQM